ncbi:hypothetical protein [Lacinutrix sp. MedPE-SW]|uniref:hypothetical protein n=1 Tax=Lacinutrix sp. MedPE-SW TaxID=1860087 RepID=UPI000A9FCBCE|nr:hypothetical protein [Lacinutrix sp. MedPE-SW]
MKRVTFVFIGIVAITSIVLLSHKKSNTFSTKYVKVDKVDTNHNHLKGIYD